MTGKGTFPSVLMSISHPTYQYIRSNRAQYHALILGSSPRSLAYFPGKVSSPYSDPICKLRICKEYIVVRNAGGRAEPAIRDISVLCSMAKITDLVVIHHAGKSFISQLEYLR